MLNTYSTDAQDLATDDIVVFDYNGVARGCSTKHIPGTTTIYITVPGYYFVTFDAIAKASEDATTSVDYVCFQLQNNGTSVPAAEAAAATTEDDLKSSYSFSTIIKVLPSCPSVDNTAVLTVKNTGLSSVAGNVNLTVFKL